MRKFFWTVMILSMLASPVLARATVKSSGATVPEPNVVYGEITGITPTQVILNQSGKSTLWRLTPETRIYCNGLPAVWKALLPVTHQSFFEARIELGARREATAIHGFYQGEICVLKDWRSRTDGTLEVELTGADSGITRWRCLAPGARAPQASWLAGESEIYVLYNQNEAVRGVYLPDF